jgi:CcmD family protein
VNLRSIVLAFLALSLGTAALPATAPAQDTPPAVEATALPTPAAEPAPAPLPSESAARSTPPRTLRAHAHVYAAFAVTWLLLFGYAISIGRRARRLEDELNALRG